jgi:hypothetical protein
VCTKTPPHRESCVGSLRSFHLSSSKSTPRRRGGCHLQLLVADLVPRMKLFSRYLWFAICMNRRTLLKTLSVGIFSLGVAGCTKEESSQSDLSSPDRGSSNSNNSSGDTDQSKSSTENSSTSSENASGVDTRTDVQGVNFSSDSGTCGGLERARVSWKPNKVTVRGVVAVPNPCRSVQLSQYRFTGSGDELELIVESQQTNKKKCRQCAAGVSYTIVVELNETVPNKITVYHRSQSGKEAVTTSAR